MKNHKPNCLRSPEEGTTKSVLEEVMREGARKLLQMAIENEVEEFLTSRYKKGPRAAKLATARRLLAIVYRVLKEKDPFKQCKTE